MVTKHLVNGSATIAQEGNLGTWKIGTKRNFAMINKINNRFRILRDIMFSVVSDYYSSESRILYLEYGMDEFSSQEIF